MAANNLAYHVRRAGWQPGRRIAACPDGEAEAARDARKSPTPSAGCITRRTCLGMAIPMFEQAASRRIRATRSTVLTSGSRTAEKR